MMADFILIGAARTDSENGTGFLAFKIRDSQLDASIGDRVWNDLNGDGVQDGGEPGLAGITIDLYDDLNGNGVIDGGEPMSATATTDASGAYDFIGLAADAYIVQVRTAPTEFNLTGGNNPHAVTLAAGEDYNDADFGYQLPSRAVPTLPIWMLTLLMFLLGIIAFSNIKPNHRTLS